jgi:pimeloyl-ACP methyl ester carboxylesterase
MAPFRVHDSGDMTMLARIGVLLLLAAVCAEAPAADYAREKRWADEITPAILVGDPVYLTLASGHRFLAIYENPKAARAAVVVVHGAGVHPDWGLVNTLRSRLPESGYATLSVQMPVLAPGVPPEQYAPTFPEAVERLTRAMEFLRARGHRRIAIVSHSLGARMANEYLVAATVDPAVSAWASLGLNGGEFTTPARLRLPVLDLYGERDFPAVLASASGRAAVLARLPGSAQIEVAGADHFYNGREDEMLRWVRGFLDKALRR